MFPFLTTRAGNLAVRAITLIEDADENGFCRIHYNYGAGERETSAHELSVNRLLNRFEDDEG